MVDTAMPAGKTVLKAQGLIAQPPNAPVSHKAKAFQHPACGFWVGDGQFGHKHGAGSSSKGQRVGTAALALVQGDNRGHLGIGQRKIEERKVFCQPFRPG